MELCKLYKSVLDQDSSAVVICDTEHIIVYMNPVAVERYSKWGGAKLMGSNLKNCHNERSGMIIDKVIEWFKESKDNNCTHTFYNDKENKDVYMIALRDEDGELIGYYEKHAYRNLDKTPFYEGIKID